MRFLDKLKGVLGTSNPSSAEVRAALKDIDIAALEASVQAAERARAGLLLDGTEVQLDKADELLKQAVRERDRAIAAQTELTKRLAAAEAAEAADALDADRDAVVREGKAVEAALRDRWPTLQAEMVAMLEKLQDIEIVVAQMNERLAAAGRTDRIAPVETRVWPAPQHQLASIYSIANTTFLRELPGAAGWGAGMTSGIFSVPSSAPRPDPNPPLPQASVAAGNFLPAN
jgi:hypothetical protein